MRDVLQRLNRSERLRFDVNGLVPHLRIPQEE
jgi:hypothetical protein